MLPSRPPNAEVAQSFRASGYWQDRPVGHFLQRTAARHPDVTAVIDGERRLTFADVDREATPITRNPSHLRRVYVK